MHYLTGVPESPAQLLHHGPQCASITVEALSDIQRRSLGLEFILPPVEVCMVQIDQQCKGGNGGEGLPSMAALFLLSWYC